ncbi:uncharacterized protein isoform X2 [Leptinotarsa decemlineata]|uniref:uncharacterized protein isoform X2 n=1 Tax=Leptinotarsa decemlineata TaxID=7539 RepID=UPI003D30914C
MENDKKVNSDHPSPSQIDSRINCEKDIKRNIVKLEPVELTEEFSNYETDFKGQGPIKTEKKYSIKGNSLQSATSCKTEPTIKEDETFINFENVKPELVDVKSYKGLFTKCELCTQSFDNEAALFSHKSAGCIKQELKYNSSDIKIEPDSELQPHEAIFSEEFSKKVPVDKRIFQCNNCLRQFTQKGHLKEHLKTHTGLKPFQCQICLKSFSRENFLKYHLAIHTGEKPFPCKMCPKAFVHPGALRIHEKITNRFCILKKHVSGFNSLGTRKYIQNMIMSLLISWIS